MALLRPHALQVGSSLGRYTLASFLGEGGFAEVWLGRDPSSAEEVAIKVVRRGRVTTAGERAMFLDEANIAAGIRHPNVIRVFEIGDQDGLPYLVMEHVSGCSLETVMDGAKGLHEPVPIAIGVTLMAKTCAGLHAAHELTIAGRPQHVVHRDVSPQNVLITDEGVPKVIDFGIAKARERISKQTSTGIAKGKISYMAPEQARGASIDRRADIWSVGMVLFELLEGDKALRGPNEIARLQALVSRPLRLVFSRTPDRIAAVIKRAIAFEADDRQATADEVRIALEDALAAEELTASAAEIRDYCGRARIAAELSAARKEAPLELVDLLPSGDGAATISVESPVARPRRNARRIAFVAMGAMAVIGLGGVARFAMTRGSDDTHANPNVTASTSIDPPRAVAPMLAVPAAAVATSASPLLEAPAPSPSTSTQAAARPRSPESKGGRAGAGGPLKAGGKGKPAHRPSDYAQIE